MLAITLTARNKTDDTAHEARIQLSESDRELLRHYLRNTDRLEAAQLVQKGLPRIKHISMGREGLKILVGPVDYSGVCELLHLARPIFLSSEPASFQKTMAFFGRQASGTFLATHLKHLRHVYENGDYKPYFQVTVGELPLFHDASLSLWLNGVEYHQDPEKAARVRELEVAVGAGTSRGIFVAQLSGRLEGTFKLAELARYALRLSESDPGEST